MTDTYSFFHPPSQSKAVRRYLTDENPKPCGRIALRLSSEGVFITRCFLHSPSLYYACFSLPRSLLFVHHTLAENQISTNKSSAKRIQSCKGIGGKTRISDEGNDDVRAVYRHRVPVFGFADASLCSSPGRDSPAQTFCLLTLTTWFLLLVLFNEIEWSTHRSQGLEVPQIMRSLLRPARTQLTPQHLRE